MFIGRKSLSLLLVPVISLLLPLVVALPVGAEVDIPGGLCMGTDFTISTEPTGFSDCATSGSTEGINALLQQFVNIISAVVGVVAVIMIIVGGFKYITSGGDNSNVAAAKNTIIYAIIGLIIVALAQLIVRFVLSQTNSIVSG